MIVFCTYFDRNYLTRGLALYESMRSVVHDLRFAVLALDDDVVAALGSLALPGLTVIPLRELEAADPEVAATRGTRSNVEYYFTLTPALPLHIFSTIADADVVAYADADLCFYSDPGPVLSPVTQGNANLLVVPHGFSPGLEFLSKHGTYNVGLVAWRRSDVGLGCLRHWRSQCIDWCYDRIDGERYADQGYLNDWPTRYQGVVVSDAPGVGLAPWNVARYRLEFSSLSSEVDGQPIVYYHFQGVSELGPHLWSSGLSAYRLRMEPALSALYRDYIARLEIQSRRLRQDGVQATTTGSVRSFRAVRIARALFGRDLIVRP